MMMNNELKCADLVVQQKERRIDQMRDMLSAFSDADLDDWEKQDDAQTEIYEWALHFCEVKQHTWCDHDEDDEHEWTDDCAGYWQYQISWGGPSDEFRFHEDGSIEYRYHDWFDGAGRVLHGEEHDLVVCFIDFAVCLTWRDGAWRCE
jgi:hypothetical protein